MFLSITVFFGIVHLLGWTHITELRAVNLVFVIYFSNKLALTNVRTVEDNGYLQNLASVFLANCLNVVLSFIGFFFFVRIISSDYLEVIMNSFILGKVEAMWQMYLALFIEGCASGAVVSFAVMQYWKNNKKPQSSGS
jgi:hypothetical protein